MANKQLTVSSQKPGDEHDAPCQGSKLTHVKRAGLCGEPKAPGAGRWQQEGLEVTQPGDSEPDPAWPGLHMALASITRIPTLLSPWKHQRAPGMLLRWQRPCGNVGTGVPATTSALSPAGLQTALSSPGPAVETRNAHFISSSWAGLAAAKEGGVSGGGSPWDESVGRVRGTERGDGAAPAATTRHPTVKPPLWKTYIVGRTVEARGVPHRGWARDPRLSPSFFGFLHQLERWCVGRRGAARHRQPRSPRTVFC